MKLIFIYGPPASGKLTIAEKLSELTGAKIFHNHMSNDMVYTYFPRSKETSKLVNKIRMEIFSEAARQNVDLIFTYLYVNKVDDNEVKEYSESVEKYGGKVCFVQITCPVKELIKRVTSESRKTFHKIHTEERLLAVLDELELDKPIGSVKNCVVDTSGLSPQEAASKIIEFFNLTI